MMMNFFNLGKSAGGLLFNVNRHLFFAPSQKYAAQHQSSCFLFIYFLKNVAGHLDYGEDGQEDGSASASRPP